MYKLVFTESYERREAVFIKRHPEMVGRYKKVWKLLELNPLHPSLKLHKLKDKFQNKHAVSITDAYRVIIAFVVAGDEIIPIDIGHHEEVTTYHPGLRPCLPDRQAPLL